MTTVSLEVLVEDKWVARPIELPLEEDFSIEEHNVDGELCSAGRKLAFYGSLSAEFYAQLMRKKNTLEREYALEAINTRTQFTQKKIKATEGMIKETVVLSPHYIAALDSLEHAERGYKKLDNLWRGQQKRVDALIALAYKQRVEYGKSYQ